MFTLVPPLLLLVMHVRDCARSVCIFRSCAPVCTVRATCFCVCTIEVCFALLLAFALCVAPSFTRVRVSACAALVRGDVDGVGLVVAGVDPLFRQGCSEQR